MAQVFPTPGATCDASNNCSTVGSGATPLPVEVTIFNLDGNQTAVSGSISGNLSTSGPSNPDPFVVLYAGVGATNDVYTATSQAPFSIGPSIVLNNAATIDWSNIVAAGNTGAIFAQSVGALGIALGEHNFDSATPAAYVGGDGGEITIQNSAGGTITISGLSASVFVPGEVTMPTGLLGRSLGGNGNSYDTKNFCCAGSGGAGGQVSVSTAVGSFITLNGPMLGLPAAGIQALSFGGQAATASFEHGLSGSQSGLGGNGGPVSVAHNGTITNNVGGVGILAASVGGPGNTTSGFETAAGTGGQVSVSLSGTAAITVSATEGPSSIGVFAASSAGSNSQNYGGTQAGGNVTVSLDQGSTISVSQTGRFNIAVLAVSSGSASVLQPFNTSNNVVTSGAGTSGTVTVTSNGSIQASGYAGIGIAALSVGGAGIVTSTTAETLSYLGNSGTGYQSGGGAVVVSNGGSILTNGTGAHGILAASSGGGGILSSDSLPTTNANGWQSGVALGGNTSSSDSDGHAAGAVQVSNMGTITTGNSAGGGTVAMGIVAQSIGGGGGSFAGAGAAAFIGDSGGGGGGGGQVTVDNSGTIATSNDGAVGILAQSVGGGGGNGANAAGIFVATGGQGGNGGNGGQMTVNNDATGSIMTVGDFAAGVIAQSVGGGGGNGGYATSAGPFVSAAIGGAGGDGGNGETVLFTNAGTIATAGQNSLGLLAQSVGGGGGNGGAATSIAVGLSFSVNLAVGGTGGGGGAGDTVAVNNVNQIITKGPDAIGLVAQSVGGGGGAGGASVAKTLSISVPDVPAFSFTASAGGSGGSGGDGGSVIVRNAAQISTSGDGAHGILVQSIGGGGGNGGDSTAASYAVAVEAPQVQLNVALGATGGNGGSGGTATLGNGASLPSGFQADLPSGVPSSFFTACPGCVSTITTGGSNAAGIAVQSIGGGGGNSTAGNASALQPLGNLGGSVYAFDVSLGASGGAGGSGGEVKVGVDASTTITTAGSGSPGILAQSIGGGGGSSSGGSFGLAVGSYNASISAGGIGVAGSTGGTVTVANAATIITYRGDSIGILAQSIGGGGGLAGSNDAAASITAVNQIENGVDIPTGVTYDADVAVGGKGGSGGDAGTVSVTNTGGITTGGERAYGIEAQSIGGGGGNGGSATATATGTTGATASANVAIGGSGGVGGSGNAVSVGSSGAILTSGYNAHGILAQSIGGGGGAGGDGSVAATTLISLGAGETGGSGGAGNSGSVTVTTSPGGSITTRGDDAAGILAQAIGGGGGTGTAGCGNSCLASAGTLADAYANTPVQYSYNIGGGPAAGGTGSVVEVSVADKIATTGARAMGVVAQSIGGGGGFAPAAAQNVGIIALRDSNASASDLVGVTLQSSGSIATSGAGAWGILAQSIGGGGGFAGDASLNLLLPTSNTSNPLLAPVAFGGPVRVAVDGNITTTGANAHGVFAQSIGGGGGIVAGAQKSTSVGLLAGNTADIFELPGTTYTGAGGAITIIQGSGSTIQTSGIGSIGIVAQSTGGATITNPISVTVSGAVVGGTNSGYDLSNGVGAAGILLSGGGNPSGSSNTIIVNAGGSVGTMDGVAGAAIISAFGMTNIINAGTITGSIGLLNLPGTVTNSGVLNTGASITASTLTNSGTISPFGRGTIGTTNLTGQFTQTGSGQLVVDVNALAAQQADLLNISGAASVNGVVVPVAATLLPVTAPVISASGGLNTNGGSIAVSSSSLLFQWAGMYTATQGLITGFSIFPSANFSPKGVSLTSSQQSLANNLTNAWNNADSSYATKFGYLSQITNPSTYAAVLDAYSPKATQAQLTALTNVVGPILGAAMSCPVFVDQGVLLGEDNCAWAKVIGQQTTQSAATDTLGYQVSGVTYRLGAQHEFAPNWYLGASFGTGQTWSMADGGSSGYGRTFDGSVAVKHTMGPWLLAGSIALAGGTFHSNRAVNLPGIGGLSPVRASLQSDPSIFIAGGRVRAAYEFTFDNWYLRPYGDFDVIYTNAPGFQESGQADFALNVRSNSKTSVAISPMVEFGGRMVLGEKTTLRPFVAAGVSFLPDNTRYVDASFVGALPSDGTFRSFMTSPSVLGNFDFGVQLYRKGGFEAKAEYGIKAGSSFLSQSGSARIAYHF